MKLYRKGELHYDWAAKNDNGGYIFIKKCFELFEFICELKKRHKKNLLALQGHARWSITKTEKNPTCSYIQMFYMYCKYHQTYIWK